MSTTQGEHVSTGWTADASTFGARLALVRQRMKWGNLKEAAVECGLPPESWRQWERDGAMPRRLVEVAQVISRRTGCDFMWLLAGPARNDPSLNVTRQYDPLATHIITRPPNKPSSTPISVRSARDGARRPTVLRRLPA